MSWNTLEVYIRENQFMITCFAAGIIGMWLFLILLQVTITRREVHKICKKVRNYFEVILKEEDLDAVSEPVKEATPHTAPMYEMVTDYEREQIKKQKDAELLMEVISEVF